MNYTDIFNEVKKRIDVAVVQKDFRQFELADLGFTKNDVPDDRLVHFAFNIENEIEKIEIDFRCYDQSGPFLNMPDMNKFYATYFKDGAKIDEYTNTYED